MRFYIALWFAKLINVIINIIDSSRGSSFSGEKAMKIDPNMISHFKGIDCSKVLFITGTNGKSTTTNLINHVFKSNGKKVVVNLEGANLIYGIATALSKASSMTGKIDADYIIFETDERYLPLIHKQLPAENILITNLQKDQVQRNGDPDLIYSKLSKSLNGKIRFFLNNEEPRSKSFEKNGESFVTFGAERHAESFEKDDTFTSMACPICRHKINFNYYNNDGVGNFHCSNCDLASEKTADYTARDIDFENAKFKLDGIEFDMPYNIPYMCYNYAAAVAVAKELGGIAEEDTAKAFKTFKNIGGRYEVLKYKGKTIKYMRIKQENPETLQTALNVMAADKEPKMICLGMCAVLDIVPFYTNTFYMYDCDFKGLANSNVEKYYCFSKTVCYDTAKRLMLDGIDKDKIFINETDRPEDIFKEIENAETDNIYLITRLDTFFEMQKYANKEGC